MAIRVLVVDDSALVRQVLSKCLGRERDIEVVGAASDPFVARDLIISKKPDVMTLDVHMPRMDGIEFLRRLIPQHPMPVVMVSSMTDAGTQATLEALNAGAVDFVSKPSSNLGQSLPSLIGELATKIRAARHAKVRPRVRSRRVLAQGSQPQFQPGCADGLIALGASTGGTEALREVLKKLPTDVPGVVVVQHMPPRFTKMYADQLNLEVPLEVREARDGDRIVPGCALIAPGGSQMEVLRRGGQYQVRCQRSEKVSGHCPSVDVLFRSVAVSAGSHAVAAILTGMGADGADGMVEMRGAGAYTIGQDEETSVIYGMPKVAFERGGVEKQLPLEEIGSALIRQLSRRQARAADG